MTGTKLKTTQQLISPVVTPNTTGLWQHDFKMYQFGDLCERNLVIHVKPVMKLRNIVPKLKKKIWLLFVVIKETGGTLRFFLATCIYHQGYQCPFLVAWVVTLFLLPPVIVYQTA